MRKQSILTALCHSHCSEVRNINCIAAQRLQIEYDREIGFSQVILSLQAVSVMIALVWRCVCCTQIQTLLQDVDVRNYQIETFKDEQSEAQKRDENLKRQLDKLTYDKNSLQADLTASRDELDEARQNNHVTFSSRIFSFFCAAFRICGIQLQGSCQ